MTVLDWSGKRHWRGGYESHWSHPLGDQGSSYHGRWVAGEDKRARCIHCRGKTFLVNDDGDPSHKTCQEQWQDRYDRE